MNTSAEAADQIVRMSLNGTETALKLTGSGAKEMSKLLYKLLKDISKETHKTKGQMRLANLIKSGKKLDIYQVKDDQLKMFCTEAKKYGIVYTILKDRDASDGKTEIMAKADDKAKIDRILERLGMGTVTFAKVDSEKEVPERATQEKAEADKFIDDILKKPNPTKEETQAKNPSQARTNESQSVPTSKAGRNSPPVHSEERTSGERPSVRKELERIKAEQERRSQNNRSKNHTKEEPMKINEHKAPKKKKDKER